MPVRLWNRVRDWVVLYTLLAVSVLLMLTRNDAMLRGMRVISLDITSRVETRLAWVGRYVRAIDENEALRRHNIELSGRLARLREAGQQIQFLTSALDFQTYSTYVTVAARIVTKDIFGQTNFATLDVGRDHGVEMDMAVVTEHGILGRVIFTSDRYSRILPILSTDFRVPAHIDKIQAEGIISWPGVRADRLLLENVAKTEAVEVGDLVVTSRASGIFPPDYAIGSIVSVVNRPGENLLDIYVQPAASISTTNHAFVILRQHDQERTALEARQP